MCKSQDKEWVEDFTITKYYNSVSISGDVTIATPSNRRRSKHEVKVRQSPDKNSALRWGRSPHQFFFEKIKLTPDDVEVDNFY